MANVKALKTVDTISFVDFFSVMVLIFAVF